MAGGPAPSPMANRVRVEVQLSASFDIGQRGLCVQEEDQGSPLAKLESNGCIRFLSTPLTSRYVLFFNKLRSEALSAPEHPAVRSRH